MRSSWILVLALTATAHAQNGENKAAASAAFEQGKTLMASGQIADACDQFKKSEELDPQWGTQYNLALCYEALGKLASAYGEFDELSGKDTNAKRKSSSKDHAKKLKPRLTQLTLIVHDPSPDLKVTRDGEDITVLIGVTTPVDPGKFTFEASAPGYETWSQPVDVSAEGATITVEIPALTKKTDDGGTVTEPDQPDHTDHTIAVAKHPAKKSGGGRKLLGLSIAGAGLVSTGLGMFFGLQAKTHTDNAKEDCLGELDPCIGDVSAAQTEIDSAKSKAMLSNVFVGVGVAALAGGIVLWLTAPSGGGEEREAMLVPVVGASSAGLVFDGRF